jgi:hypothetical protein
MSEIRVNKIQPASTAISFTGITTFSSTGSFSIPLGTEAQRPSAPVAGQVRVLQGEIGYAMEYYNGTSWVTV